MERVKSQDEQIKLEFLMTHKMWKPNFGKTARVNNLKEDFQGKR